MTYNFIQKSRLENYSTTAKSNMYSPFIELEADKSVQKKIISGIELINNQTYASLTSENTIQYFSSAISLSFLPYKNMLDHLFGGLLDLSWLDTDIPVTILNIQEIGDGMKHNSLTIDTISKSLTDTPYTNKSRNLGYVLESGSPYDFAGYILYNYGVIVLSGAPFSISNSDWNDSDSYIQHSINIDNYTFKYDCYISEETNLASINMSYYSEIDEANETITAALTSFWAGYSEWSNLTITDNASDWFNINDTSDSNLYITQLGLYNENNECLAVAALNRPFKLYDGIDLTFKLELNI